MSTVVFVTPVIQPSWASLRKKHSETHMMQRKLQFDRFSGVQTVSFLPSLWSQYCLLLWMSWCQRSVLSTISSGRKSIHLYISHAHDPMPIVLKRDETTSLFNKLLLGLQSAVVYAIQHYVESKRDLPHPMVLLLLVFILWSSDWGLQMNSRYCKVLEA